MHGIGKGENIDIVLNATREDTFTKVRSRREKGKKRKEEPRYPLFFEMGNAIFIRLNTTETSRCKER